MNRDEHRTDPDLCEDRAPGSDWPDPQSVLRDARLTRQQKIEKLRRWCYDARELEVANGEGMGGPSRPSNLRAILVALRRLGATDSPTLHEP